ncbi:MAG TPA: BON domain-containing protein [Verrucomicrobiae bacterium]|nr:BON domain-containing protein [Verrucomicrobiae bacterium]
MMKVIKTHYPLAVVMAGAALAFAAVLVFTSQPVRASETDNRIESAFKNTYAYKTYLKDEHIQISSKHGAVTLSGDVYNETHKPMAADTAEALPGVRSVDNRIEVKGDQPTENSDAWVSMKVKAALLYRRYVSGTKTEVSVKDGIVTLKGEAANEAQKQLTADYAKDIVGVKSVKNEMTVATTSPKPDQTISEKIDDASITAQVKGSLLWHRSTSVLNTKVTTTDGVVTVSGTARNAAEKALVTKLVTDINGVKSVVNNMVIEETVTSNQ